MLVLVGVGYKGGMATLEALEVLSRADKVYIDVYTNPRARELVSDVERVAPGKVVIADRRLLEEYAGRIIEESSKSVIAVVVAGDPLIATTHVALLAEAKKKGIEVRYYPGVSGVCAAKAASLLHYYRFGRTVTVPGPWRGVKAYSLVEFVYSNLCNGLHTAALLDVDENSGEQLSPGEAASILMSLEREVAGEAGFPPSLGLLPALLVEAGAHGSHRVLGYSSLEDLARRGAPGGVYTMVIPAEPHPTEAWAISEVYGFEIPLEAYKKVEWDKICRFLRPSPRGAYILG